MYSVLFCVIVTFYLTIHNINTYVFFYKKNIFSKYTFSTLFVLYLIYYIFSTLGTEIKKSELWDANSGGIYAIRKKIKITKNAITIFFSFMYVFIYLLCGV